MMNRRRVAAAGALLFCLACGGSGGNNSPSLTVSPATTTVTAGGAAVAFNATLNNASGTISWTLTGPGSINPASGTSTSYTPPASVAASTTATLTASVPGGPSGSATITISVAAPITVSGTVVDNQLHKFPGVSVIIGAQNTVTNASGQFTISNVTPPYDLTAIATITGQKGGSVYKGLTRTDPTILVPLNPTPTLNSGSITGAVTGGDPLGTAGEETVVAWGSTQVGQFDLASQPITSSPYTLNVSWPQGQSAINGGVHVLQWAKTANIPSSYKGYAVKTGVAVAASGTTNNVDLAMTAPGTSTVGGSVTLPSGVTLASKTLGLTFDDTAQISLGADSTAATSFSYLFPNVTGATAAITAGGSNAGGDQAAAQASAIALGTTNVSLAVPTPTSAILPANNATGIGTATDFSWTPMTGGNVVYILQAIGPSGQPEYVVFTTATTARLPDLSAQGLGLPSATAYSWTVLAVGPHVNLDSAAGAKSILPTGNALFEAQTKGRNFTTP